MNRRFLTAFARSFAGMASSSSSLGSSAFLAPVASSSGSLGIQWARLFSNDAASPSFAASANQPHQDPATVSRAMSTEASPTPTTSAPASDAPPVPEGMSLHRSGAQLDLNAPAARNPDPLGVVHVSTTKNNTIITLTDLTGRTRTWASGGTVGERNSRKGTSFAAELAAQTVGKRAMELGLDVVKVKVKGIGQGRDSSIKGLKMAGVRIVKITDATPIPHNGCRPPKRRRT